MFTVTAVRFILAALMGPAAAQRASRVLGKAQRILGTSSASGTWWWLSCLSVDPLYLKVPDLSASLGSGQQDSLLVRVETSVEGVVGWGECDSSPLVGIAAYVCPPSHSCIRGIASVVVGETIACPADIVRLHDKVLGSDCLDIQHAEHAYSGCDIALWDALGKVQGRPVYKLLHEHFEAVDAPCVPLPKLPYASVLFEDTPEQTRDAAVRLRASGYSVVKFGWGPMGRGGLDLDVALVRAARDGLGPDVKLCVDAGTAWKRSAADALRRVEAFKPFDVFFLEEPVLQEAVGAYREICDACQPGTRIAGGEGSDTVRQAEDFIVNGGALVVQIDPGRIGGLTSAYRVRQICERHGRVFVNHTFKSHLSIAAALHVMATDAKSEVMEYPQGDTRLSAGLVTDPLLRSPGDGLVRPRPERPGLGVDVDLTLVRELAVPLVIDAGVAHASRAGGPDGGGSVLYRAADVLAKLG